MIIQLNASSMSKFLSLSAMYKKMIPLIVMNNDARNDKVVRIFFLSASFTFKDFKSDIDDIKKYKQTINKTEKIVILIF